MNRLLLGLTAAVAVVVGLPLAAALTLTVATSAAWQVTSTDASASSPLTGSDSVAVSGLARQVLAWADAHAGDAYRMGADGPDTWDCSSFTQAAWAHAGVRLPGVAQDQRDWLASGHGTRIPPGGEQPGDLIFWDSYLGPSTIGHVVLVHDPTRHSTIEAHNTQSGVGHFTYQPHHHRYEIYRPTPQSHAQPRATTATSRGGSGEPA